VIVYLVLFLSLVGCRCGQTEAPKDLVPVTVHYAGWQGLSRGVVLGRIDEVRRDARDLTAGSETQTSAAGAAEALNRVSASLGFLQIARSAEDLSIGISRAATACGACHLALQVEPLSERPPWSHQSAWDWAIFGAVWGKTISAPVGVSDIEQTLQRAYTNPPPDIPDTGKPRPLGPEQRLESLLDACWACHATD